MEVTDCQYYCCMTNTDGHMLDKASDSLKKIGGFAIQRDALDYGNSGKLKVGTLFTTVSGKLPQKRIVHLVALEASSGRSDYKVVKECLTALVTFCKVHKVKSIAIPAIGSRIGGLPSQGLASIYAEILGKVTGTEIYIVDKSTAFIHHLNTLLNEDSVKSGT